MSVRKKIDRNRTSRLGEEIKEIKEYLFASRSKRTALIDGEKRISFEELYQKAVVVSQNLKRERRCVVALFLPNGAEFIYAFYGILLSDKIVFPLNTKLTAEELRSILKFSGVALILTDKAHKSLFRSVEVKVFCIEDLHENGRKITLKRSDPDKPAILLSTSGTTGNQKIVMLSQNNALASSRAYLSKMNFSNFKNKRYLLITPFSSAYGIMILLAVLIKRYELVLVKDGATFGEVLRIAEREKAELFEGASACLLILNKLNENKRVDFEYPKYFGFGGSKVPEEVLVRLYKIYPDKKFWQGYGMTEAGPLIAKPYKRADLNRLGSVGTAVENSVIKIEADGKLTQTSFVTGEICFKGPGVMLGYYKNIRESKKAVCDGYLKTGDIGYLDDKKFLYICGRKKNIIIVRGFNVFVEEVEEALLNSGLAADCKVYARQCEGAETVCADIVKAHNAVSAAEIIEYLATVLADYKIPRKIVFVNALDKNASGKIFRYEKK